MLHTSLNLPDLIAADVNRRIGRHISTDKEVVSTNKGIGRPKWMLTPVNFTLNSKARIFS